MAPASPSLDIDGAVATVTLHRPGTNNKIEPEDLPVLRSYLANLNDNKQVRMIIFASTGKSFSSSFDLGRLGTAASSRPAAHWIKTFNKACVPVGPIHDVGQALEHGQSLAISMVVDVDRPGGGTMRSLGLPIHFDGEAPFARSAAQTVGQQTCDVLKEIGYAKQEIANLQTAKIVGAPD